MSGIRIGSNIASLQAQRRLMQGSEVLSRTFERLSSGQRINSASDDAAGLAIASKLRSDSRVFSQAMRNLNDGISVLGISEGAMQQLSSILIRQRELSEQAANGTYSAVQRQSLDLEAQKLSSEFVRVIESVEFNGLKLLDGSTTEFRMQAGFGLDGSLVFRLNSLLSPLSTSGTAVGTGAFSAPTLLASAGGNGMVQLADLNGDGKLDIIGNQLNGTELDVFMGNGNGTFQARQGYFAGNNSSARITDLNADGKLDVVYGLRNGATLGLGVMFGNGNGTFQARATYMTTLTSPLADIELADFSGDGKLDIVAVDKVSNGNFAAIFLGNGNGSYAAAVTYYTGSLEQGVDVGDLNEDGKIDLIVADQGFARLTLLYGNGNGTFLAAQGLAMGFNPYSASAEDLDGDDNLDLVVVDFNNSRVAVRLGDGAGNFGTTSFYTPSTNSNPINAQIADMNGDGFMDIVTGDTNRDTISVFLNNGNGTFQASTSFSSGGDYPADLALGDLNGDAAPDIVAAHQVGNGYGVLLGNSSTTTFTVAGGISIDLSDAASARSAMDTLDSMLARVNQEMGNIGTFQSRMEVALRTVEVSRENFEAAAGRILDADIAVESAQLSRVSILQQAAASVLAAANQQPALALQLLQ